MRLPLEPIVQKGNQGLERACDLPGNSGPELEPDAKNQECLDLFLFLLVS